MRGKMLTLVFACQPLGQLAATLVALMAAANQRNGIPGDATVTNCNIECTRTLDSIWRWIIGVGVIPAVIAIWFRLTIIESPRYTADVGGDTAKAASELKRYLLGSQQIGLVSATSVATRNNSAYQRQPFRRSTSSGARSGSLNDDALDTQQHETQPLSRRSSGALSINPAVEEEHTDGHEMHPLTRTSSGAVSVESGARSDDGNEPHNLHPEQQNLMQPDLASAEGSSIVSPLRRDFDEHPLGPGLTRIDSPYEQHGNLGPTPYQDDPEANLEFNMNRLSQRGSKLLFLTSTGPAFPRTPMNGNVGANSDDNKQPPPPSWEDFKDYFWHKGNIRTLVATSLCWFCVDLPCKNILSHIHPTFLSKFQFSYHFNH